MTEIEHNERRDELASYLLGALEPGEAAELEQHLADCAECRAELDRLRPAVAVLPESVERRRAPGALRDRVMREVRADAERLEAERRDRRRPGRRWTSIPRPAIGLAAVLLIAAVVAGYSIRGDGDEGATVATQQQGGISGRVVTMGDAGTLRLTNVRRLPPRRVLQAWVSRGGQVEAAGGTFEPDATGTARAVIDDMQGVEAVMVTVEPRGGSTSPTSAPFIEIPIS